MARQSDSPFTNVRLMVAGIAFGVVGASLAWFAIANKIEAETGGTVQACFLEEPLKKGQPLTAEHVGYRRVPQAYAEAAHHLIDYSSLARYVQQKAVRNMQPGEPLSKYDLAFGSAAVMRPAPQEGAKFFFVPLDEKRNPGESLQAGDVVSLSANFSLTEGGTRDPDKMTTIIVFDRVQVRELRRRGDTVKQITIEVANKNFVAATELAKRAIGGFIVGAEARSTVPVQLGDELTTEARNLLLARASGPRL